MTGGGGPDAKVLVVTGQTGTGKSTVCRWLAQRGAFVIDADRVGHEVLLQPAIRDRLVEVFSPEILDEEGVIDRRALGRKVFADEAALAELNLIVHPPLVERVEARIQELRQSCAVELIVVDAALHFLFKRRIECDAVLLTVTGREEQLRRIMSRDGIGREEAENRLARQAGILDHREEAEIVLDTSASCGRVRREMLLRVDAVLDLRLARSDFPPTGLPAEDGNE